MKLNIDQILARANEMYCNQIAEKYKTFPDLDMNLVELQLQDNVLAVLAALIESLNEQSK